MKPKTRKLVMAMATKVEKAHVKRLISNCRALDMNEQEVGKNVKLFWKRSAKTKCIPN